MAEPGRPLKFKSLSALSKKINEYFNECDPHWIMEEKYVEKRDEKGMIVHDEDGVAVMVKKDVPRLTPQVPYTITGLAMALGTTRETLLDYEEKAEFSDTIKAAKLKCQNFAELKLFQSNSTGPIFSLKNNYNWKDRTEVEHSGEVNRNTSDEELDAIIERANTRKASTDTKA